MTIVTAHAPRSRTVALALLAGCGRVAFDPLGARDAAPDVAVDAAPDAGEPGLLLHFAFDTTGFAHDLGPAHHDVTCTGCPQLVAGRVGDGAAHFDGASCLVVPDGPDLRPAAFTIAYWFLGESPNQSTDVLARPFDGATGNGDVFEMAYDSSSAVAIGGANNTFLLASVSAGWHHFAYVFDGNLQSIYIDGSQTSGPQAIGAVAYSNDDDLIGCDFNTGVYVTFFLGSVDDLRLYDRVLTTSELAALAAM